MDELKRCPCCNGEAKMLCVSADGLHYDFYEPEYDPFGIRSKRPPLNYRKVQCWKCGLQTKIFKTEKGASNAWNRRENTEEEKHGLQ